jgi:Uma2 family endonuclease
MAKIITADYELDLEVPSLKNMTDDEFFDFCAQNKNVKIERDENHQIYIMAPAGNLSSSQNLEIAGQLFLWNKKTKFGIAFDSSAGFYLPDGSMLNPDAAWINKQTWDNIETEERKKFAYIAPDFIIELMSPSDRLNQAKQKMEKWIKNGVLLGWLIDLIVSKHLFTVQMGQLIKLHHLIKHYPAKMCCQALNLIFQY